MKIQDLKQDVEEALGTECESTVPALREQNEELRAVIARLLAENGALAKALHREASNSLRLSA